MVLLLVTHYVEVPSSRVPLAVIILNDAIPEEFTYGLALELTTSRAAEKVATGSQKTIEKINSTSARVMESVAEKLDRLDARTNLLTATREATSAAVGKVRQATDRALESEGVQRSLATLNSSLQAASTRMGKAFTWVNSKVKENFPVATGSASGVATGGAGSYTAFESSPPSYNAAYGASSPSYVPLSTSAPRGSPDGEAEAAGGVGAGGWGVPAVGVPAEEPAPMPHFTLHDEPAPGGAGAAGAHESEPVPLAQAAQEDAQAPVAAAVPAH
ncbi:hypothetical protein GPECTOR_28g769 [Gonium pectorale]|uniref:Uncharacterized protein n=1 Tax=Gonium pectorale TaxID=33097 RepID=A0A150GEU9_GONPE|nr:hypothetical protein GPECTOR_28g769 [Gonium pectorale]|eukprot:KXZ48362.1 hypothetical protein GPECTOR_28g769 [Gonium pectorale]